MNTLTIREATEPPEARGITRDAVRMMVAHRSDLEIVHTHAHDLPQFLDEGYLVVVNTSGTLAAAVDALGEDGTPLVVHLSQRLPAGLWLVELRRPNGRATEPWFEEPPGHTLRLIGGGDIKLLAAAAATLGYPHCIGFLLLVFLSGGVIAVALALLRGQLHTTVTNVRGIALPPFAGAAPARPQNGIAMPYAVAIFAGAALLAVLHTFAPHAGIFS